MQFFVVFSPKKDPIDGHLPQDFPEVEKDEQAQTRVLYSQGNLRQVWALAPKGSGAAVLFEADDERQLEQIIDTFPLIKRDYAYHEVFKLEPHPAFVILA